jgi:Flp pilus assembly protein TadB
MIIDRIETNLALEKAEPAKSEKQSARSRSPGNGKEPDMLWTVGVILLVLWALGLVSGYTMGGIIHLLLVIALIVVAVQFFQGRRRV